MHQHSRFSQNRQFSQTHQDEAPSRRDIELDLLLQEVAEDAQERSGTYSKETIVPEGGE